MAVKTLLIMVLGLWTVCQARIDRIRSPSEIVQMKTRASSYSRGDPPTLVGRPTQVKLGVYINSFSAISEENMEYTISFYLRQTWIDPRLAFDRDELDGMGRGVAKVRVDDETIDEVWRPDVFFRNEKKGVFHHVTTDNRLMTVQYDGSVWYVLKLTATMSCPMRLRKFPHDTQRCPLMFESFGYTMDTVYFSWLPSPVDIDGDMRFPRYDLRDIILYDCSQNYTGGAYPCLEIRFVLRRDIGYHVMQYFIPTIFIVMLSWFAFWIDVKRADTRFTYGILTFLVMAICMWGSDNGSLSSVSYVKAIDVWTLTCVVFLFAAIVESAVVSFLSRNMRKSIQGESEKREEPQSKAPGRVDIIARIAFPVCFVIFNIIYWVIYNV